MERRRQREDSLAVLDSRDASRRERPAVPDAVHQVNQRHRRIAWADEVGVQRVHRAVFRHGPARGNERLTGHLAAEYPLPALVLRAAAAEDVDLDLLQVEEGHHAVQCLAHDPAPPVLAASVHNASTAAPYRSSLTAPTPGTLASSAMLACSGSASPGASSTL